MHHNNGRHSDELNPSNIANQGEFDAATPALIKQETTATATNTRVNESAPLTLIGSGEAGMRPPIKVALICLAALLTLGAAYLAYSSWVERNRVLTVSAEPSPGTQAQANSAKSQSQDTNLPPKLPPEETLFVSAVTPNDVEELFITTEEQIEDIVDQEADDGPSQPTTPKPSDNPLSKTLFPRGTTAARKKQQIEPINPQAQQLYLQGYNLRHVNKSQAAVYLDQALQQSRNESMQRKISSLLNEINLEIERSSTP